MKQIDSLAFLVFTTAFFGCIENPGPDPRLNRDLQKGMLFLPFQDTGGRITLHMELAKDTLRLRAENTGNIEVDSAVFLVEGRPWITGPYPSQLSYFHEVNRPVFERLVRLGRVLPWDSRELGAIDSAFTSRLQDYSWSATILDLSENGSRRGTRMGCAFRGTFRRFEPGGVIAMGTVRGTLSAEGQLKIGFYPDTVAIEALGKLEGLVRADSAILSGTYTLRLDMRDGMENSVGTRFIQGRWGTEGGKLVGAFHLFERWPSPDSFQDPLDYPADSLEIRVEPYFPE